jgi:hypothetical protein
MKHLIDLVICGVLLCLTSVNMASMFETPVIAQSEGDPCPGSPPSPDCVCCPDLMVWDCD